MHVAYCMNTYVRGTYLTDTLLISGRTPRSAQYRRILQYAAWSEESAAGRSILSLSFVLRRRLVLYD
jgi:hypothetical protein